MSDKGNIDQLLKDSFDGFAPKSPDVWGNISGQLGHSAAQTGLAGKAVSAFKSASIAVKIAIVLSVPVAATIGYVSFNLQENKPNEPVVVAAGQITPVPVDMPAVAEKTNDAVSKETPAPVISQSQKKERKNVDPEVQVSNETGAAPGMEESGPVTENVNQAVIPQVNHNVVATKTQPAQGKIRPTITNRGERVEKKAGALPVQDPSEELTIPNVFTPNDDGKNDEFKILISNETSYFLSVYDADGNQVFESTSPEQNWDGKHYKTGQLCEKGMYTYLFSYELKNGKTGNKTGKLELIR